MSRSADEYQRGNPPSGWARPARAAGRGPGDNHGVDDDHRVEVRRDDAAFTELEGAWDDLYARCPSATPFQSHSWLASWWRHYGRPGRLRLVLVWRGERLLAGAALMMERRGGCARLTPVGGGLSDFTDVLLDEREEPAASRGLCAGLAAVPGWAVLDLPETRSRAAAHRLAADWPGWWWRLAGSTCLDLPGVPLSELMAGLPTRTARHVRRKLHRIEERDVRINEVPAKDAARGVARLLALHEEQWRGRAINPEHLRPRFAAHLTDALPGMVTRGQARLSEYRIADRLLAVRLSLVGPDLVGGYLYGTHPDLRELVDIATLLLRDELALAHQLGRPTVSMLRGEEPYKMRWQPSPAANQRLLLARPGSPAGWAFAAAARSRGALVAVAKRRAPWLRDLRDSLRPPPSQGRPRARRPPRTGPARVGRSRHGPGATAMAVTALLLTVLACSPGFSRATPGVPTLSTGREAPMGIQVPLNAAELDRTGLNRALDAAQRVGATEISGGVAWWYLTAGGPPDRYDWVKLDALVDTAVARGLRVHLQLSGTPDAVHPEVVTQVRDPGQRIWYAPRTPEQVQAWGRFVHATVTHFRGRVASYELWNEPNSDQFFKPRPDPGGYARMLATGYRAAKQVDPGAQVLFGGLSRNDIGFLRAFYTQVRHLYPDVAAHRFFFDQLVVHPYTDGRSPDETTAGMSTGPFGPVDNTFSGLWRTKEVMDQSEGSVSAGAADADGQITDARTPKPDKGLPSAVPGKSVTVGEFGYTTTSDGSSPPVPDDRRAYFYKQAVALAKTMPFVAVFAWYGFLADSSTGTGWAVLGPHGEPSWTYQAMLDTAAGMAPTVRLPPLSAVGGPRLLHPTVKRLDLATVSRSELYVDGILRLRGDGAVLCPRLDQFAEEGARAQLVLYTRDRHVWPSDVVTVSGSRAGTGSSCERVGAPPG